MTTPELSGYKFETFQEGGEVFAMPIYYTNGSTTVRSSRPIKYPILNIPAGKTVEGRELVVVWQYQHIGDLWETELSDDDAALSKTFGINTRIALRHKSPAQQNDTNVEGVEETWINPHKNQIELADNKGHVYLAFDNNDTANTIISTPLGSLVIPESEAVKLANQILNNYYGV